MSDPEYDYKHCPLDNTAKDLRILQILDNGQDVIECNLVQHDGKTPYNALSWCWGSLNTEEDKKEIRIIHNRTTYAKEVTPNLELALKQLRERKQLYMWIDAVCINQKDSAEKNNQVPMMAKIYGRANCVYVWLGDEKDESKLAIEFIENRVLNLKDFDSLVKEETNASKWSALSALMRREWFSRRWVVQEIALAKEAMILCGTDMIKWLDFADAISLFNEVENRTGGLSELMKGDKQTGHMRDFFGDVAALSATRLVEVTNNLFRRRNDEILERRLSLEHLVSTFTAFNSTQARDTIYASLAIARDTQPKVESRTEIPQSLPLSYPEQIGNRFLQLLSPKVAAKAYPVDYELPISDVYVQFVKFAVQQSEPNRALDIICRPWAPDPKAKQQSKGRGHWRATFDKDDKDCSRRPDCDKLPDTGPDEVPLDTLPSWIPSISGASHGKTPDGKMTRINADSLVGVPPQVSYMAAGGRSVTKMLRFEGGVTLGSKHEHLNNLYYHSMFVEGFVLDKVKDLAPASQSGVIPEEWFDLGESGTQPRWNSSGQDLQEDFWRTLVADRAPTGDNAYRYYPRLISYALQQGATDTSLTVNTDNIINQGRGKFARDVLKRIQSVIWNRCLIRTGRKSLGLAPKATREGDLICILYGCSVPVVLRRFGKSAAETDSDALQRKLKRDKEEEEAILKLAKVIRQALARRRESKAVEANGRAPNTRSNKTPPASPPAPRTSRTSGRKRTGTEPIIGPPSKRQKPACDKCDFSKCHKCGAPRKTVDPGSTTSENKLIAEEKVFYQLIGECYVHGVMNGEAIDIQAREELKKTLFEIR